MKLKSHIMLVGDGTAALDQKNDEVASLDPSTALAILQPNSHITYFSLAFQLHHNGFV